MSKKYTNMDNNTTTKTDPLVPQTQEDAVWLAALQVSSYVNFSEIARKYFGRTAQWLTQRLHGNIVNGKPVKLKPSEANTFAAALRDIATKLNEAATLIETTPTAQD